MYGSYRTTVIKWSSVIGPSHDAKTGCAWPTKSHPDNYNASQARSPTSAHLEQLIAITAAMGFFDYVSDIYSSLSIQTVEADAGEDQKYASGDFNSSKDQQTGTSSAEHSGRTTTKGGASTSTPASGTDEESADEAEVNKADAKKSEGSDEKGHTPGEGGEASGQVGADRAGPHGGPVGNKAATNEDEQEEEGEEEEEEEEDDEPVDPKPKLEEGMWLAIFLHTSGHNGNHPKRNIIAHNSVKPLAATVG